MLRTEEVVAFIATAYPERAKAFYRDALGLALVADEEWALVFDAGGTMLRIQKTATVVLAPYTSLGWRVPDVGATLGALAEHGIEPLRYDFLSQDERGIWSAPDGTSVAWFRDPDGNLLSVTSFPTA